MLHPLLRTALSIAAIGSLIGAALSCSGGSGTATGKDDFIAKYCAEFSPCCAKAGRPTDGAACRAVLGALAPASYDPAAGNECLMEIHAAASSPTFCDNTASGPSCNKVFSTSGGTVQPGGTCTQDQECAPSAEGRAMCAI